MEVKQKKIDDKIQQARQRIEAIKKNKVARLHDFNNQKDQYEFGDYGEEEDSPVTRAKQDSALDQIRQIDSHNHLFKFGVGRVTNRGGAVQSSALTRNMNPELKARGNASIRNSINRDIKSGPNGAVLGLKKKSMPHASTASTDVSSNFPRHRKQSVQ